MKSLLIAIVVIALFVTHHSMRPEAHPHIAKECLMLNGKQRPYPCEFEIVSLWFMGKNGEVIGKITPSSKSLSLPASKAVSQKDVPGGGSLFYKVSIDFRRINTPSFSTATYTLSRATITDPISPGETTPINNAIRVSSQIAPLTVRPNRVMFDLQLNYTKSDLTLVAPVRLIQLENPVTFAAFPKSINRYRDRAEAWIDFMLSVDFKK